MFEVSLLTAFGAPFKGLGFRVFGSEVRLGLTIPFSLGLHINIGIEA